MPAENPLAKRGLPLELTLALLLPAIIVGACIWLTWTATTRGFTTLPEATSAVEPTAEVRDAPP